MASLSMPCSIGTRTYMPGSSSRLGLGNSPRSVTCPVWASTLASENSSLPAMRIERAVVEHEAHLGGIGRDALEVAALEGAAQTG